MEDESLREARPSRPLEDVGDRGGDRLLAAAADAAAVAASAAAVAATAAAAAADSAAAAAAVAAVDDDDDENNDKDGSGGAGDIDEPRGAFPPSSGVAWPEPATDLRLGDAHGLHTGPLLVSRTSRPVT